MKPNIRKSITDLTFDDLISYPLWEFASDEESIEGQDETTIRPIASGTPAALGFGVIAAANFELADGTRLIGYVNASPEAADDISAMQPVVVCDRGQVGFWFGALKPNSTEIAENLSKFGRTMESVFPIKFSSRQGVLETIVQGEIPGFMMLIDDKNVVVRE
jgi:hypothetical protein